MAVKYVSDFEFPADFGFHKSGSTSVPGKAKGGSTTPQRYAKGGHSTPYAYKNGGVTKYSGHAKKHPGTPKTGMGADDMKHSKLSKPAATRSEKSSGVQKPAFARGGSTKVAAGKVAMGEKKPWNQDDAVSPGSYKRTPPGQGESNMKAAKSKFSSKDTDPATPQTGDVERMSGYSDFKKGGKVHKHAKGGHTTPQAYKEGGHAKGCSCKMCSGGSTPMPYKSGGHPNRIKNLGHYAHGGKAKPKDGAAPTRTEKLSAKAVGKHTAKAQGEKSKNANQHEPKATRHEVKSSADMREHSSPDVAEHSIPMASGGLGRGTNKKKQAAIHAKMEHAPGMGALGAAMAAPHMAPPPGLGTPPPGAPMVGGMRPSPMGGAPGGGMPPGAPMMSHGGAMHVVHHHIHH